MRRFHSLDYPPIAAEDLVELGVESQLTPLVASTALHVEQWPDDSPPLTPAEAKDLVESLDKVRRPRGMPQASENSRATR